MLLFIDINIPGTWRQHEKKSPPGHCWWDPYTDCTYIATCLLVSFEPTGTPEHQHSPPRCLYLANGQRNWKSCLCLQQNKLYGGYLTTKWLMYIDTSKEAGTLRWRGGGGKHSHITRCADCHFLTPYLWAPSMNDPFLDGGEEHRPTGKDLYLTYL